jgi:hypothetical protein
MPCFNELFIMLGFIVLVAVLYFFFRAVHYVVSGATGFFANDRSTRLSGRQRVRSQTTTMPYTDTSPNLYSSSPPQPSGFEMWRKHPAYNPISLEARNQAAWLEPLTNPPLRRGEQKEGSPNWNPVLMQRKDYRSFPSGLVREAQGTEPVVHSTEGSAHHFTQADTASSRLRTMDGSLRARPSLQQLRPSDLHGRRQSSAPENGE